MIIGVRKETKNHEYRVALLPGQIKECLQAGADEIWIETGAGEGATFSDNIYKQFGAKIKSREDIFENSDIILGVKELNDIDLAKLSEDQIDVCFQHYAAHNRTAKCKQISYEDYVVNGERPILKPMSIIAGRVSVLEGIKYLLNHNGGPGILATKASFLILGAGTVGFNAAMIASAIGSSVTVYDVNSAKLDIINQTLRNIDTTTDFNIVLERSYTVMVGAVYVPKQSAPKLISEKQMNSSFCKVFIDVSIDQGGCSETSYPTSHDHPVYVKNDVIHYCVPNIPGVLGYSASTDLCYASIDLIKKTIAEAKNA